MKKARLLSVASYVPEGVLTNADLERMVETSDQWILERTGIRERHIAPEGCRTSMLATEAAKLALERAGIGPDALELIALGTASPDMLFPSTACYVAHNLGARRAAAFDLSGACSGFVYSVAVGVQFLRAGAMSHVMAIGSEMLSRITDYTDRTTCILFGDGAGAAVLTSEDRGHEILDTVIRAGDTDKWEALCLPAGGTYLPASEKTLRDRMHYIKMQGREVYKLAITRMIEVIDETLRRNGLEPSDIGLVVPHQMNVRIIQAVAERLGFPMERFCVNLDRYGNTSSASIPISLDEAIRGKRVQPGQVVMLVSFGGGFTWGTVLLRW